MRAAFVGDHSSAWTDRLVADLKRGLAAAGVELAPDESAGGPARDAEIVFNLTRADAARPNYLRESPRTFVCTIAEAGPGAPDVKQAAYRALVQTMSNLLVYAVPDEPVRASWMVTPELGFREVPHDDAHLRTVLDKVLAISGARFVIDNELVRDLPVEEAEADEKVEAMKRVGRRLDGLGLLPSVLPLDELLSERELRLLMKVFGVRQLSYGNLSTRRDESSFWMSGRGVDKGNLQVIGRDVLLVTDLDEEAGRVQVRVPEGTEDEARVSVDAVEHALIYRELPEVGAIIHVHAWLPGIESTLQNYPCGTVELAREVLELVQRAPDPGNAVVGLLNHGITATGPDLDTLFDRIAGRLERQVPMA